MPTKNIDLNSEFVQIKPQLMSYLYRLSANKEDTEDLLHDTYIRTTEKIHLLKEAASFKTWVFTIATNLARDNKRVKKRWDLDVQDKCKDAALSHEKYQKRIVNVFHNQPNKQFEIEEHINYCFTCVAKNLSIEQQISIILKEFYHFKRSEIAKIMGKTEGVIKHLLFDARKELQTKYNNLCAMINKTGACYQCAELNDFLQDKPDAEEKIGRLKLSKTNSPETNLDIRFKIINQINPLNSKGAELEDTILKILREVTQN